VRVRLRTVLLLDAAAIAAAAVVILAGLWLPLLARRGASAEALLAVAALAIAGAAAAGGALLVRSVARPLERIFDAAERLGGDLPVLGEGGGPALSRAALAFERTAAALAEERARLAAKVEELSRTDRALGDARASLERSERLATVGRLAAGLAHEVGNPLGAVAGYAEIARSRLPAGADPDLADAVSRIADAAARIDRTIRALLDFARPSPPHLAALELGPAIEGAVALARVQPRFRHVEVTVVLPEGLPAVTADHHQLGQVLLNLLLNAADAMPGGGDVEVRTAFDEQRREVALEVADQGRGISPQHADQIFRPFFTTKAGGTGLGLAVSKRLAEQQGGSITFAGNPGGGTVFSVHLPSAMARA